VDEVADEVIRAMNLGKVKKKMYKPVLHGVGWPDDVRRIALRIDKLRALNFKPSMNSREAVRVTAKKPLEELNGCIQHLFNMSKEKLCYNRGEDGSELL